MRPDHDVQYVAFADMVSVGGSAVFKGCVGLRQHRRFAHFFNEAEGNRIDGNSLVEFGICYGFVIIVNDGFVACVDGGAGYDGSAVAGGQCHQRQADKGKLFFHVGILVSLIGVV